MSDDEMSETAALPATMDESSAIDAGARLAAGRADAAVALLIDTLAAYRRGPAAGEALAAALFEREAPAELAPDALAAALARIDALDAAGPDEASAARDLVPGADELIRLPEPLRGLALEAAAREGWRRAGRGIRRLSLQTHGTARAEILRIEPGAASPRHTHGGAEYTLCLSGGFSDERGSYGPGDLSFADTGVTHQPRGDADGVCLVLAVTDADLRLTGLAGAVQKLLGL